MGGGTDYDADADGLIEISSLAQLNAMRWDIDGDGIVTDSFRHEPRRSRQLPGRYSPPQPSAWAAPWPTTTATPVPTRQPVCIGYELTANLDFDENDDGSPATTPTTPARAGSPSAASREAISQATFDGNGHTISNLFINRSATDAVGLFGESIGTLRNVGLEDVDVTSGSTSGFARTGSLAGWNNGTVTHSWANGSVTGENNVGGLIGEQGQFQGAITSSSYAAVSVSGARNVGGLVGHVE